MNRIFPATIRHCFNYIPDSHAMLRRFFGFCRLKPAIFHHWHCRHAIFTEIIICSSSNINFNFITFSLARSQTSIALFNKLERTSTISFSQIFTFDKLFTFNTNTIPLSVASLYLVFKMALTIT